MYRGRYFFTNVSAGPKPDAKRGISESFAFLGCGLFFSLGIGVFGPWFSLLDGIFQWGRGSVGSADCFEPKIPSRQAMRQVIISKRRIWGYFISSMYVSIIRYGGRP